MGEKKELRAELAVAKRTNEQLLAENEALRSQLEEKALVVGGSYAPPFRLPRDIEDELDAPAPLRLVTDHAPTPTRERIAIALGIDRSSYQNGITDEQILEAVERLRNPGGSDHHPDAVVMTKGDSLADAIQHNRKERSTLEESLVQARNVINRVAGALGVGQWNTEGDEIVDKAQRFGVFAYYLRKRHNELLQTIDALPIGAPVVEPELAAEVRKILAALVGDKELARILQNKPVKASKTVLDLAETPAPTGMNTYLERPFDKEDVFWIRDALKKIAGTTVSRVEQLMLVFERIASSPAAIEEFTSWMNAVVLPVLRKQHPAYRGATKEN